MIGCVLVAAAGVFLATRAVVGRRFGGCGGGWHRRHLGWHHGGGHGWHHGGHGWHGGHGGGWGGPGGGWGGEGGGWGGEGGEHVDFGGGAGFFARGIASRVQATPAQERVIKDALGELREVAGKLKGEARKTRADVAAAFRKPQFDEVQMGELYARHDRGLEELRKAFVGAGAKIHDALDEEQRVRLASLIESGAGWWRRPWRE